MLEEGKTVPLYTLTVLLSSTERYGSELLLRAGLVHASQMLIGTSDIHMFTEHMSPMQAKHRMYSALNSIMCSKYAAD